MKPNDHGWIGYGSGAVEESPKVTASATSLRPSLKDPPAQVPRALADLASLPSLREVERAHIVRVLAAAEGSVVRAARILGISRWALGRRLRKLGIPSPRAIVPEVG